MYMMGREEAEAAARVIESGKLFRYLGGEERESELFEKEWSEKIGVEHTVTVTSGTAALICALVGLNVGPGDEVIVPGYTFMASAMAALAVGAIPIIAEIDDTLTIDPADIEKKITSRTKVIMPVHMNGLPSNMDKVMEVAKKHSLLVCEDCAQADGGSFKGKRLGSFGDVSEFSFNYFKIVTCGEGGAVCTDNREVYERTLMQHDSACIFRDYAQGIETPYFSGWNFRTNEILTAIMRVQLRRLDGILDALRKEKKLLMEMLSDVSAFTYNPVNDPEGDCATTLMLCFESAEKAAAFAKESTELGVGTEPLINSGRHVYSNWEVIMEKRGAHHPGRDPYQQPGIEVEYSKDMCPNTLDILGRTVGIGPSPTRSLDETKEFAETIRKAASSI
jgi:dTDP-4-amino-4,6-dideoxygalactose transaminase